MKIGQEQPGSVVRPFFLFSTTFSDFALKILEHMALSADGLEPCGMTAGGGAQLRDRVTGHPLLADGRIDDLGALEHLWLETPVSNERKCEVRAHFSHWDIRRIAIADRHVGARYVSGGVQPMSRMIRLCSDELLMERYLWNLCLWVIDFHEATQFDRAFCYALAGAPAVAIALYSKNRGIPFRKFTPTRIGNRYVVDSSIDDSLGFRVSRGAVRQDVHPSEADRDFARGFLYAFRDHPIRPDYEHRSRAELEQKVTLRKICANLIRDLAVLFVGRLVHDVSYLRRPTAAGRLAFRWTTSMRARRLLRRWPYDEADDLHGFDYVFYPLHVDPEASTMMLAPMFTDQVAVIEALSKSLPLGMKLVVKEHAPMLGRRPPGFYDRIASYPNVVLLPPTVNNFALMGGAELVAVITGTAAWEALLLGGRALMLGSAPYMSLKSGLTRCTDLEELPQTMERALQSDGAKDQDLIAHIAAVYRRSFEYDWWHRPFNDLTDQERERITDFVAQEILGRGDRHGQVPDARISL